MNAHFRLISNPNPAFINQLSLFRAVSQYSSREGKYWVLKNTWSGSLIRARGHLQQPDALPLTAAQLKWLIVSYITTPQQCTWWFLPQTSHKAQHESHPAPITGKYEIPTDENCRTESQNAVENKISFSVSFIKAWTVSLAL